MDSTESEDTGVFSPEISRRDTSPNPKDNDTALDTPEIENTNVFSPYVPPQPRLVKSLNSHGSKENTPPVTETPSITKCLEGVERRNVKRKNYFHDALTQTSCDDSSSFNAEDGVLDDLEKQEPNRKRTKRFQLSLEESTNNSTYDDTGIGSSSSQEKNQSKRKRGFVVVSNIEENDDSRYSEISLVESKTTRKSRFVPPSSYLESDDSLPITSVFKSSTKYKKSNPHFKVPKSPARSQDSTSYSDIFPSQDEKKLNRKPRFDPALNSQENDDSSSYSDIFKSTLDDKKVKQKHSEIEFGSKRENGFAHITLQSSEDSSNYDDVPVMQPNKSNRPHFKDLSSQETDDSQGYSDVSVPQNETNAEKNSPFVDPISQEVEGSLHYSDIPISTSQNISTQNSFGNEQQKCETINSTVSTSVRSIFIDTYRSICSSLNGSEPFTSKPANKPFNETYDVSTSAFCQREEDCSLVNVTVSKNDTSDEKTVASSSYEQVTFSLDISNECTLVGSKSLADANESATLIESKNEDSDIQGSCRMTDESKHESSIVEESIPMIDGSKLESCTAQESISVINESKQENSIAQDSIPVTDESKIQNFDDENPNLIINESVNENINLQMSVSGSDCVSDSSENSKHELEKVVEPNVTPATSLPNTSKQECSIVQDSISVTDELKVQNFHGENPNLIDNESMNENFNLQKSVSDSAENSKHELEKVVEPNVTLATSLPNTLLNSIVNSSALSSTSKEIVEESVYVAFNPSSLMLSVTELVEASLNCVVDNKSNLLEETAVSNNVHSNAISGVIPPSEIVMNEENIKEHDYALAHISNAENPVVIPSSEEITNKSTNKDSEETWQEPASEEVPRKHEIASSDIPCPEEIASIEISNAKNQSKPDAVLPATLVVEPTSNDEQISKTPSIEISFAGKQSKPDHISVAEPTSNDEQIPEKTLSSNISIQSANYSLRERKSRSNLSGELNVPLNLEASPSAPSGEKQPSVIADESNKSAASISPNTVTQRHEESAASNVLSSKSNYSLRTRKSRSSGIRKSQEPISSTSGGAYAKKSPEPVPNTSAAASNHQVDDTGEGLFDSLNSLNNLLSQNSIRIASLAESYSSHSRNSTSHTFVSKSSVSVFSISKIGRRLSAPKEFKVPEVPKVLPKKRKRGDPSFKHLPSRPNFPKFDSFCNKRFYDYITGKMEPKYGIRTNNKAVEMAKYLSEVVKEVIVMKTGEHHILIEEMKKMLFKTGIVTTHYNFYMFCFDYMPAWFRRKAIPMMQPVNCPPNVQFDSSLLFESIG